MNERSPRVYLRHPVEADREEYTGLRWRSRAFLEPWDSTPVGMPEDGNYTDEAFTRALAASRLESSLRFVVCRAGDGAILGSISITNIVRGAFQSCTVGYWMGAEHAGLGYMTEGLALVLHYCFGTLGLHRVEANIVPTNEPSTALVKRLGFRNEGVALRYLRINWRWEDHVRWGMTLEDYTALCSEGTLPFAGAGPWPIRS